jgi:hypothetical protein
MCVGIPKQSTACSNLGTTDNGRNFTCCVAKPCSAMVNEKLVFGTCVALGAPSCLATFESDDCLKDEQVCCLNGNSVALPSTTAATSAGATKISLPNAPSGTSDQSLPVPPTSSLAPTNPFPVAIVAGSVCGAIVLVVVVVVLALVAKKRRRSDSAAVGSAAAGSDGMSSFTTRSANPNQYAVIPVVVGAPYGSLSTSASPPPHNTANCN